MLLDALPQMKQLTSLSFKKSVFMDKLPKDFGSLLHKRGEFGGLRELNISATNLLAKLQAPVAFF